jgi:hypothetical protein
MEKRIRNTFGWGYSYDGAWFEVRSRIDHKWHHSVDFSRGLRGHLWYKLASGESGLARPKHWRRKHPKYTAVLRDDGTVKGIFSTESPEAQAYIAAQDAKELAEIKEQGGVL